MYRYVIVHGYATSTSRSILCSNPLISFLSKATTTIISLYNIATYKRQCVKCLLLIIHTYNLAINCGYFELLKLVYNNYCEWLASNQVINPCKDEFHFKIAL